MEILIGGAVGLFGYMLSRNSAAPGRPTADRPAFEEPSTLLKAQDALAGRRWTDAQSPNSTGIVGPKNVPFFQSIRKQNTNEPTKQRRMELYTGNLEQTGTWQPKRESRPRFAPTAQPVTSSGSSGNAVNYAARRSALSGVQNNVLPFAQQRVGPGLNVGVNTPAADGFHSQYRPMPLDYSGYKANELEGRVIPGGSAIQARQVDPSFYSKGVPRFWDMDRRPLERGMAAVTARAHRPEIIKVGGCHVDTQEYFGGAMQGGQNVQAGAWTHDKTDQRPGLPLTNATGSRAGVGAFTAQAYDGTRFTSQNRESERTHGVATGDQRRHQAPSSFVTAPTQRSMAECGYNGIAGHFVPGGTAGPEDAPQPTLREQLHDQSSGPGIAAPHVKGATVQCTDRQLLKEAKRGSTVVNTYVTHPERTEAFRRANVGDVGTATQRCQARVAVRAEPAGARMAAHAAAPSLYSNMATAGASTGSGRMKLPEENRFQDFGLAKSVLATNPYSVNIN